MSRLDKADATKGTQSYTINIGLQAELELPSVRSRRDMLQELKALGNSTLIEGDALVVALKKKSWNLTRRDRDANVYCGGWRDGMINSGGMRDLTSLFWTL